MMTLFYCIILIILVVTHLISYKASVKLHEHTQKVLEHTQKVLDCAKEFHDNNEIIIKLNKLLIKELTKQNNIKLTTDDNEEDIDKLINEL